MGVVIVEASVYRDTRHWMSDYFQVVALATRNGKHPHVNPAELSVERSTTP